MDAPEVIPPGNRSSWGCIASAVLVLGFLAIYAFPGGSNSPGKESAARLQAQTAMKGLYIALAGFETEYQVTLPSRLGFEEGKDYIVDDTLIKHLMAAASDLNVRQIRFYDPPEAKKGRNGLWRDETGARHLRAPWGGPYRIRNDANDDGKIANPQDPAEEAIDSRIAIYSAGPDHDFATWEDNVTSWR